MRFVSTIVGLACAGVLGCSGAVEEEVDAGGAGTAGTAGQSTGGTSTGGTGSGGTSTGGTGSGGTSTGGTGSGGTSTGGQPPEKHRPTAAECDDERPSPEVSEWPGADCQAHSECTEGRNGRCTSHRWQECTYDACIKDADCGENRICECEGGWASDNNVCLDGNCRVDADCPGSWCSPTFGDCGNYSGVVSYYCRTPEDTCLNDSDCTDEPEGYCAFSPMLNRWACSYSHCVG